MSSSKTISRLDVENSALSFENLGTPSIGAKKSYSSNSLESMSTSKSMAGSDVKTLEEPPFFHDVGFISDSLRKSYNSLVAAGANGVRLTEPDPVPCQRVYTPKYVKSYSPDWFGFVSPGNTGSMFTVPDPDYFPLGIEYKVDPFLADLIANCPPPIKKSSSECSADSPEPCRICYNTHGFSQCPYVCSSYPRGADFNREYFVIACRVGHSSFDVDEWVCNACGQKTAALARKYCIICRSYTTHCTYECPKDEALAAQHNLGHKPKAPRMYQSLL